MLNQKTPWCNCECHVSDAYKHFAPCCCQHRIRLLWDCPECCTLPRNSKGACAEHNHHSQYNEAWGKGDWELTGPVIDLDGESLEEHKKVD